VSVRRFLAHSAPRHRGQEAEAVGAAWLETRGYRIVARNESSRYGELDVIALDGETLCFVEIKARSNANFGPAIEAVTFDKQRRIARAARGYLMRKPYDGPCRFDVLGMDATEGGWRFELIRDAFQLPG
jgi:putative endonuclease